MVVFARQYDLLGNWTNFKQDTDGDGDWDLNQNRTHNEANEIATIAGDDDEVAHDRAGNMIRAPKPSNWTDHYHFEYDAWNRLVTVYDTDGTTLVAGYDYDGLNRRVIKETYAAGSLTELRHYYYSAQWQVLEERVQQCYGSSGSASAPESIYPDRQFVWGLRYVNDLVLRDRDTDTNGTLDERIYALQDPNWNVVAIANTSGVIQERYCYSAYGAPSVLTSSHAPRPSSLFDWETLYCGYRYDYHTDSDVKWHIAGHRILLSHLGRWNRRDPITYWGGDNLYQYCGDSPLTRSDPLGLKSPKTPSLFDITYCQWKLEWAAAGGAALGYSCASELLWRFLGHRGKGQGTRCPQACIDKLKGSGFADAPLANEANKQSACGKSNSLMIKGLSGSYEFTEGDLYYALKQMLWSGFAHGTSSCGKAQAYTVNGKQSCCCQCSANLCFHATVTDRYDFCSSLTGKEPDYSFAWCGCVIETAKDLLSLAGNTIGQPFDIKCEWAHESTVTFTHCE